MEVHNLVPGTAGPFEQLYNTVKARMLRCYRPVSCLSGLTKTTLQGNVNGARQWVHVGRRTDRKIISEEWTGLILQTLWAKEGRKK